MLHTVVITALQSARAGEGTKLKIGVVDCKVFYSIRLAAKGCVSNQLCREKNKVSVNTKHAIQNSNMHAVQDAKTPSQKSWRVKPSVADLIFLYASHEHDAKSCKWIFARVIIVMLTNLHASTLVTSSQKT